MHYVRRLAAAAVLANVAGCADMRTVVPDDEKARMRTIAVASALGNTFHGYYMGLTVFNQKTYEADVSAWNVDETALRLVTEALNRGGKSEVVSVTASGQGDDVGPFIVAARAAGADTLVLVVPAKYDNLPRVPPGYGFRHRLIGKTGGCVYLLAMVKVYDVAESRRIAWQWALGPLNFLKAADQSITCYGGEDPVGWRDDFSQYTDAERERLRLATIHALETNIRMALDELNLAPE